MLTQPRAEQLKVQIIDGEVINGWIPVQQTTWFQFGPAKDSEQVAEQARTDLGSADLVVFDGLGIVVGNEIRYLDPKTERIWVLQGTTTQPDGKSRIVKEFCGNLVDRKTKPFPGDTPGGPTLVARPIGEDDSRVELFWSGQAESEGMLGQKITLPNGQIAWLPGPEMNQSMVANGDTFTQDGVQYVVTVNAANQPPWPQIYSTVL